MIARLSFVLALAASVARASGFGDTSMGSKPYGVLLLVYDAGGSWRKELPGIRSQLPGIAIESVESAGDARSIQHGVDRLKAQHVAKIVAVPLEFVSQSPLMDELRYLFGIRAEPADDKPDRSLTGVMPALKPINKSSLVLPSASRGPKRLKSSA